MQKIKTKISCASKTAGTRKCNRKEMETINLTIWTQQGQGFIGDTGDLQVTLPLLVSSGQVDVRVRHTVRHADVPRT